MTNWKAGMKSRCIVDRKMWVKKLNKSFLWVKFVKTIQSTGPDYGDVDTVDSVYTGEDGLTYLNLVGWKHYGGHEATNFVPADQSFGEEIAEQIEKEIANPEKQKA